MKIIPFLAALLFVATSPAMAALAHAKAGPAAAAHVALPAAVRPDRYDILIRPDAAHLRFSGEETIALTIKAPTDRIVLNAADIAFQKAALSGDPATPRI